MNLVDWLRCIIFFLFFLFKSYFGITIFCISVIFFCISVLYVYVNYLFFSILFGSFLSLFRFFFLIYKVNFNWHERTVFVKNFAAAVFITEFITLIVEVKSNCCTTLCFVTIFHIKFCTTITFPVNWCSAFFIRKSINSNLISNHKCRIETKSEMTYNLLITCFVFILFHESSSTRKSNLIDVFVYFVLCHTNTIINKGKSLVSRINTNFYFILLIVSFFKFTHNRKLFQLCYSIASVTY